MSARRPSPVRGFLVELFSRAFRARPKTRVSDWAQSEKLMIPPEESHSAAGPYRADFEPCATIVHDFAVDPRYDELIMLKPSRMGITLAAIVLMAWWLEHFVQNIIFCIDNSKKVAEFGRTKIVPVLKSIRSLRSILPESDRKLTKQTLFLSGRKVHLAGAGSISDVTGIGAGLVIGDEGDQWKEFASGEANALEHLRDRVMDVPGSKLIFFGKPKNEDDILWPEFLTGTRHKCFVPCPHCGHMQTLDWPQLKFDHCRDEDGAFDLNRVACETYYECISPACQQTEPHRGRIEEHHKPWMLQHREWRQTNFGQDEQKPEPRKMSAHISHLYAVRPKLTWASMSLHFIRAQKRGGSALAHFFRTRLGEPQRLTQSIVKKDELLKLQGTYRHGTCPWRPSVVLMFCDVQLHEKKWVKCAFRGTGECAVIDYGIFLTYGELIPEADRLVEIGDWGDTPEAERELPRTAFVWIDEGDGNNSAKDVRDFCAREDTYGRFFPAKGAGGRQINHIVQESPREVTVSWHPAGKVEFFAYHFSHNSFATELYQQRIKKHDEIVLALAQGLSPIAQRLWLPRAPDEQFLGELCAECLIQKRIRGRLEWIWDTGNKQNDFGDGVKGCLAMWYFVRGDYMDVEDTPPPDETGKPKERDYELRLGARD